MSKLWYNQHEIVAVEYRHRKPFSVLTLEHWDHSREPWFVPGRHQPTGICPTHWDFEFCRADACVYYHESGSGGETRFYVSPFCEPSPPPGELWVADGIPIVESRKRGGKFIEVAVSDARLLAMGYRRLRLPRLIEGSRNPFDHAVEGRTVYCRECDDYRHDVDNHPCGHLEWCDDCCCFVYDSGEREDGGRCECAALASP